MIYRNGRFHAILCCALCANLTHAQPGWKIQASLWEAEASYLNEIGQHRAALGLFLRAFDADPQARTYCYDAVSAALAVGDTSAANVLLAMGVQNGFDPKTYAGAEDLQAHLASDASRSFRMRWEEDRNAFAAAADSALIKEVESLVKADQAARQGKDYSAETQRIDSANFEALLRIVDRHGFPTQRTLGLTMGGVWLLLWHHRAPEYPASAEWQRMLPHIRSAIDRGDLSPSYLCMFDDFAAFDSGAPQPWGTLLFYFSSQPDLIYLADRESLNRNRASVGLGPIEWTAEEADVDLSKVRFAEP